MGATYYLKRSIFLRLGVIRTRTYLLILGLHARGIPLPVNLNLNPNLTPTSQIIIGSDQSKSPLFRAQTKWG